MLEVLKSKFQEKPFQPIRDFAEIEIGANDCFGGEWAKFEVWRLRIIDECLAFQLKNPAKLVYMNQQDESIDAVGQFIWSLLHLKKEATKSFNVDSIEVAYRAFKDTVGEKNFHDEMLKLRRSSVMVDLVTAYEIERLIDKIDIPIVRISVISPS